MTPAHIRLLVLIPLAGCSADPKPAKPAEPAPVRIYAGGAGTCAVIDQHKLRCWGRNDAGQLGVALAGDYFGDGVPASAVPLLDLGETITSVAPQEMGACLTLEGGGLRCWGGGATLGFIWDGYLGDDETLLAGPLVDLGGAELIQVVVGSSHTCALFEGGGVKCWGYGKYGVTGYASTEDLGDDPGEEPSNLPFVDLGGPARSLSAGSSNTCAVMEDGALRCWGSDAFGRLGLGLGEGEHGHSIRIGDDETPASVEPIKLAGGPVVAVTGEGRQICALHQEGTVSCWGATGPWLGYGRAMDDVGIGYGDDEHPSTLGLVDVGAKVVELALGDAFSCARLEDGGVKCWGASDYGQLGYGNTDFVGYTQTPASVGTVDLGGPAISLTAGRYHVCALLDSHELRCWGGGGALGYGNAENIGDDETPAQAGPVPFR